MREILDLPISHSEVGQETGQEPFGRLVGVEFPRGHVSYQWGEAIGSQEAIELLL